MPKVLTAASQLECAHGGKLQVTAGQSKLKVGGDAVLLQPDILAATISGCTTPTNATPPTKPCMKVMGLDGGLSQTLKVDGVAVVLETATGSTEGVSIPPTPSWSVKDAKHTKLETD